MEFKAGDVVVLKSGGPRMTITSIDRQSAECTWFVDNLPKWHTFELIALKAPPTETAGAVLPRAQNPMSGM